MSAEIPVPRKTRTTRPAGAPRPARPPVRDLDWSSYEQDGAMAEAEYLASEDTVGLSGATTYNGPDGDEWHDVCQRPLDECPCTCGNEDCGEGIRECSCPEGFLETAG